MKAVKKDVLPSWKVIILWNLVCLIPCGYAYYRDYIAPAKAEQAVEMVLEVSIESLWVDEGTEYEKALPTPTKAVSSAKNK